MYANDGPGSSGVENTPITVNALHPGAVASREQLLHQVWGYRDGSGARTVDSHIRSLRRKLGSGIVRTVHGVGYALDLP